jgi:cytochrome oxidase assembly protein ShyY1
VLAFAAGCIRAAIWQLDRLHQRRAFNAAVERGYTEQPGALDSMVRSGTTPDSDALAYRRVVVRGKYDTSREIVLYGRALGEQPGNHVLTPLVTENGRALVVDRGWVPVGMDQPPVPRAAPPTGEVEVTGVLFPSEGDLPGASGNQRMTAVSTVDLAKLQEALPYRVYPVYLRLQSQVPEQPGALPRPIPRPALGEGPHLSYTIQWILFATIALVGYVVLFVRDRRRQPPATQGVVGSDDREPTTSR